MKVTDLIRKDPLLFLLAAVPLAIIAEYAGWNDLVVFALSALGVIPLARYIGTATEALAEATGPRVGGLLNATLGNAAELIITIVAIQEGLLELVLASITGSIIGNLLLVMGAAMLLGGMRHGVQKFDRHVASRNAILLVLAVLGLLVPSLLSAAIGDPQTSLRVEAFSLGVAVILIGIYILGLVFGFRSGTPAVTGPAQAHPPVEKVEAPAPHPAEATPKHWSTRTALIVLAVSTAGVAFLSEILVGAVEPVVMALGVSEFFLGVILIPLIGNVAEHLVAVKVALENKMDLSVEIAVASSLQIALFVAPVLVFVSLLFGQRLQLIFNEFELVAMVGGILIAALVSADGESNWLEGAELLALYLILGLAFFLLPV